MPGIGRLGQQRDGVAYLAGEEPSGGGPSGLAEPRGPLSAQGLRHGGHSRGGRAGTLAIGKDVQEWQFGLGDERQRLGEQRIGFRRKARDQVGADRDAGSQRAGACDDARARPP